MSSSNFDRYDLATSGDNVREDLSDVIYNITPTEVPAQANFGRGTSKQTLREWQIDELAAAASNAVVDGADFGSDESDEAFRIGVYMQISIKYLAVSRRANIVNKAGRRAELSYQIAKKGKELRRDVEFEICQGNATVAGNSTTPSETAGLRGWIKTNTHRESGGAEPALSNTTFGEPTTGETDGTIPVAMHEDRLLEQLADCYIAGGNPNMLMLGPVMKQKFSSYMFGADARIATQYQDQGPVNRGGVSVVGAVDVYVSDFTVLDIVPNRFQRERDGWILDNEFWDVTYLDGYKTETISKIGDAERRHILVDWGLKSNNEAASAHYADIDETTAMLAT